MAQQLVGGQWVLAVLPIWLTAMLVLFFCTCLGFIWIMTTLQFKVAVNVSFSGQVGDLFLTVIILIGATVLGRVHTGEATLPELITSWWYQVAWILVAATVGWASLHFKGNPFYSPHGPDRYHNVIIAGCYFYLIPTVIPVIWCDGTRLEWWAAALCFAVWFFLGVYDNVTGRIDQPQWQQDNLGRSFMPPRR